MQTPSFIRARASIVVAILGLVALLSCQNEVTGPQSSSKLVNGSWNTELLRLPDSATWAFHDTTGAFSLTASAKDTSFSVQAILPRALAPKDTLVVSLFTLSLRTTVALCKADGNGDLSLWDTSTHDSRAAHLLQVLDSLQKKNPAIWGAKTDSITVQIRSLQRLYATLILSGDAILKGFPAVHPVGIDSVAVIDQVLILATQQKLTLHGLDSLVSSLASLDSANVRKEVRKLGLAVKIDTSVLFPAPIVVANQPPIFSGAASLTVTASATTSSCPTWINTILPGPANEFGQKVAFEVQVLGGANLFSKAPVVDSSGTLTFTGVSTSSGVATIQVRAHDNGDSTGSSVNVSRWKSASIQFVTRQVLTVPGTGPSDTIALVEDSTVTVAFTAQNFLGSFLVVKLVPADTTFITAQGWTVKPDGNGRFSFPIQGKASAFGGPILASLAFADSLDTLSTVAYVRIAPRNRAPSFLGAANLSVVASASPTHISNWIASIAAGPANESSQKVSFEVQVQSGATLFSALPVVDGAGNLSFTGKPNTPGTAAIHVRAHDNGDSTTGSSVNMSAWKSASIVFDVPASLGLTSRTVTTWQGYAVSDTANLYWGGGNSSNLVVDWSTSDSILLPRGSVVLPATGSQRFFQMTPAPGKWGSVTVRFTVTDSLGGIGTDSLTLVVQPVNHAPVLALKGSSFLATTWKGDPALQVAGTPTWDDATTVQKGHIEVKWLNPQDSLNYLTSLRVDPTGVLHFSASVDTSVAIQFQLRAHDSSGTAHGGVDTSAWSRTITLQLVDTVKDVDGNSYRARRMPDGKVWMRQNLYTKPRNGDTAYSCAGANLWDSTGGHLTADCPKRGALYNWGTAMNQTLGCDTSSTCWQNIPSPAQGLCPVGWHVAERSEWSRLLVATAGAPVSPGMSVDSALNLKSATLDWGDNYDGWMSLPGAGIYGDFLVPTDHPQLCSFKGAGTINGANFWLPHRPVDFLNPVPGGVEFKFYMSSVASDGYCGNTNTGVGSLRCVLSTPIAVSAANPSTDS